MYPDLLKIGDFTIETYSVCMLLGILLCFIVLYIFLKKILKCSNNYISDVLFLGCIAIIVGIGTSWGFQKIFDLIKGIDRNAITFYGGLAGGALAFVLIYLLYYEKKKYPDKKLVDTIYIVAPACITIAHSIGRVGCFFAGCCYGIETDSPLGIIFPGHSHAVYPTQLFEAIFLFVLFLVLIFLAYRHKTKLCMPIYLIGYGIWRFLIEFIRGDERGALIPGLSPSQIFSILAILIGVILVVNHLIHIKKEKSI